MVAAGVDDDGRNGGRCKDRVEDEANVVDMVRQSARNSGVEQMTKRPRTKGKHKSLAESTRA